VIITRKNIMTALLFFLVAALIGTYVYQKRSGYNKGFISSRDSVRTPKSQGAGQIGTSESAGTPAKSGAATNPLSIAGTADFFIDYRLERDRVRSRQLDMLREIINNPKADEDARKEANRRWLAISDDLGREVDLESLIKAKGFEDALVFLQSGTAVVIVKAQDLTSVEVARIGEVVRRGTGLKLENINIMPKPR
jgi:stage III sporulation protein AH